MRRLLAFLLTIIIWLNNLCMLFLAVIDFSDHQDPARVVFILFLFGCMSLWLSHWRRKLRRKMLPKHWKAPIPPEPAPAVNPQPSVPATKAPPEVPQDAPKRLPPPTALTVEPMLSPVAPALGAHLRHFIEAGEQAISNPVSPMTEAPAEPNPPKPPQQRPDRGQFIPPPSAE